MTKINTAFEEKLLSQLREKKFDAILSTLKNPENESFVTENVWNIINLVCLTVKTEGLLNNESDVTLCRKILLLLVSKGNPKEVLVSLLEQSDSFKDHDFFCLLLEPLQVTLQKTPGKRGKTLQWVLSTLNAHIETLSIPEDLDLHGEEMLLFDADPAVEDTRYVLSHYLSFIQNFVDEVSFENLKGKEIHYFDRITYQQELLQKFILKLFHHPFLYHDLHIVTDSKNKSAVQSLCEHYIKCLSKICKNVFNLFKYDSIPIFNSMSEADEIDDDDKINPLAFANLSYLIFVEDLLLNFQPFVYSHLFLLKKNLKYIILLLKQTRNLVLFKGLHLAKTLLNNLNDGQLIYDCIELDAFIDFSKILFHVAIHSSFETHRKSAVDIFRSYISKFNYKGRYHIIMQILSSVKHSGAEGLVINLYKNNLHEALNGCESGEYFLGKNFNLFIKKVFVLNEGVETDILDDSDKIVTSLNFLRYLLIRDTKEKNVTGVWDLVTEISDKFLKPLTTGLDFSRAHYKQALTDAAVNASIIKKCQEKDTINTTVTVNNEILPNVPVNFQKDIFKRALVTFDMIESILHRVKELISV